MRMAYLGALVAAGIVAGAAVAASDPVPAAGGGSGDNRWRPWTGYEPPEALAEGTAPDGVPARACVAFENENFGGRRLEAPDGAAMEWVGRQWNDRISSVACAPGCRLIAYQTIVYGGARANFTGARPALGPVWNDRISALRVACDGAHADAAH